MTFSKAKKKELVLKLSDLVEFLFDGTEEEEEVETPTPPAARSKKSARAAKDDKPARSSKKKSTDSDAEDVPTLNEVRKAMRKFSTEYGQDEAKALLEPYDAKSLSALEEEDYASLLADIEAYIG